MDSDDNEDVSEPEKASSIAESNSSHGSTPKTHREKAEPRLSSVVKKERVVESALPDPFPLPANYRSDVELGLSSGKLTKEAKRAFLSTVAAKMLGYKRYPSSEEYTRVAVQIITKYPMFKPPSGSPTVSPQCLLIQVFL